MEWLWLEHEGLITLQEIFDFYAGLPADDPFWEVTIGDPGAENLFDGAVYDRGGLTLYALRAEIGDEDFLRLLRRWTAQQSGGNVNTDEFIALAERVSGEQLDDFFTAWLFTPEKARRPRRRGGFCGQRPRLAWRNCWPGRVCAGRPGCVQSRGTPPEPSGFTPARSARCRRARPPHCRQTGPASLPVG